LQKIEPTPWDKQKEFTRATNRNKNMFEAVGEIGKLKNSEMDIETYLMGGSMYKKSWEKDNKKPLNKLGESVLKKV